MSSWGWGSKFSNLQQVGDFSIFGSKSSHVQGVILKIILALVFNFRLVVMGRDGRTGRTDGTDGQQKCPSIFFILCGNLEHVYDSRQNFSTKKRT